MKQTAELEGLKSLNASMEIGLVRDAVGQVTHLHDTLLKNQSMVGKAYGIGILILCKGFIVAEALWRASEELYTNNFPKSLVQKTHHAQVIVWSKWVDVDDAVSGTLNNQLKHHPVIGKTVSDMAGDVQNYLDESKVWLWTKKTTLFAVDVVKKAVDLARDPSKVTDPENEDEEDDEGVQQGGSEPNPVESGKRKKSKSHKSRTL